MLSFDPRGDFLTNLSSSLKHSEYSWRANAVVNLMCPFVCVGPGQ